MAMIQTVTKSYTNLDKSLSHYVHAYADGDLLDIIEITESDGRVTVAGSIIKNK